MHWLKRQIPAFDWLSEYNRTTFAADLVAGLVVTMMLIPQSLAYAMLIGLPAEVGLYASIFPLVLYAFFGSSRILSVGPVALVSLMTMTALSSVVEQGTASYLEGAIILALLSGVYLLLMGIFRLGFVAKFLSHTVISGFISASGIVIAMSQLGHVLGVDTSGETLPQLLSSLFQSGNKVNMYSMLIAAWIASFLLWAKYLLPGILVRRAGFQEKTSLLASRGSSVIGLLVAICITWALSLEDKGLALVGTIPAGLPTLMLPTLNLELIKLLWLPALGITIIGYVESISVGKTLAAKNQQKIDSNQELIGLGAANIGSAFSGAFPVTGGISRSVVNYDAGAATQAASWFAAAGIALASILLAPVLYYLPKAALAATIIVSVLSLVDLKILKKTWKFSFSDFSAVVATIIGTLVLGVEPGVAIGVILSLLLYIYRTSTPHIVEVGLVNGSTHFRKRERKDVTCNPNVLNLRIDESLYFANASYLEDLVYQRVYGEETIEQVILMCAAVKDIDFSAMEVLLAVNKRLQGDGIGFHLCQVKGTLQRRLAHASDIKMMSRKQVLNKYIAEQQE